MEKMTKAEIKTAKEQIKDLKKMQNNTPQFVITVVVPAVIAFIMLYEAGGYNFTAKGKIIFWACVIVAVIAFLCYVAGGTTQAVLQNQIDKEDSSKGE